MADRLDRLREKLSAAGDAYYAEGGEETGVHPNREGSAMALAAVTSFLRNMKFERRLLEPLRAILAAFADVDEGTSNSLFTPQDSEGGAPPLAHRRAADLGMASAIITLLMARGHKEREAAVRVAGVLSACGVTVAKRAGGSDATALISWRKKLKSGMKGVVAQGVYDGFCSPPQYQNLSADELLRKFRQAVSAKSS